MSNPLTPPPELVQQWEEQFLKRPTINGCFIQSYIAAKAAQWGADQELKACCHYFARDLRESLALELRAARRPKPSSLKEQALAALHGIHDQGPTPEQVVTIRRALEALPE